MVLMFAFEKKTSLSLIYFFQFDPATTFNQADELCWTDAGKKTIECVSLDPSLAGTVGGHRRIIHTGQALRSKMFGIAMFRKYCKLLPIT